jgi:hypothetical protein
MAKRLLSLDTGNGADDPATPGGTIEIAPVYPHADGTTHIHASAKTYFLTKPAGTVNLTVGQFYRFTPRDPAGKSIVAVIPSGSGTLLFKDLVPVDPSTLLPSADPGPAWFTALPDLISTQLSDEASDPTSALSTSLAVAVGTSTPGLVSGPGATRDAVDARASSVVQTIAAPRLRLGSRWVFDGNSITIGSVTASSWNQTHSGTWTESLARRSGGRIEYVRNAAIAGTGIQSRLDNFATRVAPYSPEVVLLSEGTNDLAVVSPLSIADYLIKLGQYHDLVKGIGAQLVLGGIYPRSDYQSSVALWNTEILKWAAARNVIVIPFWELADPATGGWPSGWTSDGLHPIRESVAFQAMGALAWSTVAPYCGGPVAPTARYAAEPVLMSNFFTDLIATSTGLATITATGTTTGTLAAGTYTYRVVARTHYGKVPTYVDSSPLVLASPGGLTLTIGGSGSYNRRVVYRKGPGDTEFKYMGAITTAGAGQVFTDDGSVTPGYLWSDGDSTRVPTGLVYGSTSDSHTLAYGPPIQTDPAIRGNVLMLTRQENSGVARSDYFVITGLTPGQNLVLTCKVRGANTVQATEQVTAFFRTSGEVLVDTMTCTYQRLPDEWTLVYAKMTVPTGADRMRLLLGGDASSPWTKVGEMRLAIV